MANPLKPMPLKLSFLYFGIPALYFWLLTHYLTPFLNSTVRLHAAMSWFITGFFIFIPLFLAAWAFARKEGNAGLFTALLKRLRLQKFTSQDWTWAVGGLMAIFVFSGLIMGVSSFLSSRYGIPELKTKPGFMQFEPFQAGERWMLLVWLFMFFFNIVGEEIYWRGYLLPRQELSNGKNAWFVNSVLWGVFHLSFGIDLLILATPALLILPYAVSKTKNTTVGIFIHAFFNGPIFVLISLGVLK